MKDCWRHWWFHRNKSHLMSVCFYPSILDFKFLFNPLMQCQGLVKWVFWHPTSSGNVSCQQELLIQCRDAHKDLPLMRMQKCVLNVLHPWPVVFFQSVHVNSRNKKASWSVACWHCQDRALACVGRVFLTFCLIWFVGFFLTALKGRSWVFPHHS